MFEVCMLKNIQIDLLYILNEVKFLFSYESSSKKKKLYKCVEKCKKCKQTLQLDTTNLILK